MLTNQNAGSIAAKNQEMSRICYISILNLCRDTTRSGRFLSPQCKKPQEGSTTWGFLLLSRYQSTTNWFSNHSNFLFELVIFYIRHKKIPSNQGEKQEQISDQWNVKTLFACKSYTKIKIKTVFPSGKVFLFRLSKLG